MMNGLFKRQIVKYLIIGGLASLVYLLAANLAYFFSGEALSSTLVGYGCSIVAGYFGQMRVTFCLRRGNTGMFGKYLLLSLLMFLYSEALTWAGVKMLWPYWATVLVIVLTIPLFSFPLQKFWVYK